MQREVRSLEQRLKIYEQAVGPEPETATEETLAEAKEKAETMNRSIEHIGLEKRTLNRLLQHDIVTVGDVCEYRALELLLHVRGFGAVSLNDLNYRLWQQGVKFADEVTWSDNNLAQKILRPSRARMLTIGKMDLSEKTFAEAKAAGFRTAWDALTMTKGEVRQRFDSVECAEEFLKKLDDFGFLLS